MTTPILGNDEVSSADGDKFVTWNDALNQLEAKTIRALSKTNGGPPISPANGDVYIVDVASGAWAGKALNSVAHWYSGAWYFYTPKQGWRLWINDEGREHIYDGVDWDTYNTNSGGTTFTQGSILFADASGNLDEDNANFFWDDANNRLGVGTATPAEDFHLQKSTSPVDLMVESTAVNGAARLMVKNDVQEWRMLVNGTGADRFQIFDATAGVSRVDIDLTGNIGFNTNGAPSYPVDVLHTAGSYGSAGVVSRRADAADLIAYGLYNTSQKWDLALISSTTPDQFLIRDVTGGTNPFKIEAGAPTNSMFIGANGIGVGNSNPTVRLDIQGDSNLSSRILLTRTDVSKTLVAGANKTGISNPYAGSQTNDSFSLVTNDTERVHITNAGKTGFGTSSSITEMVTIQSNDTYKLSLKHPTDGSYAALGALNNNFLFYNNGSERLRITSAGKLVTKNGTFSNPAAGEGQLVSRATDGLLISGNGSTNDIVVTNKNGLTAWKVPTGTEDTVFGSTSKVSTGGETAPDVDPGGVCLNQGANDGNIFTFKSSDIAHGMTTIAETDTFKTEGKIGALTGGVLYQALSEDARAFILRGISTGANTSDTAQSVINFNAVKASGTGITALADTDNLAGFNSDGTVKVTIKGNGDIRTQGGISTGGESAPDVDAGGLCLNHNTGTGNLLTGKSTGSVAHGITSESETDTYVEFKKSAPASGGFQIKAYSESQDCFYLQAFSTGAITSDTSVGGINLRARLKSGTTATTYADDNNLLTVQNNTTTKLAVKGNGDIRTQGGISTGGESAPDVDAGGLCLNHGANDGHALTLKNSDIAHGVTTVAETDTYLTIGKIDAAGGGVNLVGLADTYNIGVQLRGIASTADTSDTGRGVITLRSDEGSGTSTVAVGDTGNLLAVRNNGTTKVVVKGNGDIVSQGGIALSGGTDKLDTYETGTWTPVIADASTGGNTATFTNTLSTYTRIGREVTVHFTLDNIDTTGMTGANNLYVRGLPFTSAAANTGSTEVGAITFSGYVCPFTDASSTYFRLIDSITGVGRSVLNVTALSSGTADIRGTLTYYV